MIRVRISTLQNLFEDFVEVSNYVMTIFAGTMVWSWLVAIFSLFEIVSNTLQASSQFLSKSPTNRNIKSDINLPLPDTDTVEKLNETATSKLSEIVRRSTAKEPGWEGYDEASLIAARELLNRDSGSMTR